MTQKLKLKVTENGRTRAATKGEVNAWYLVQCDKACADLDDCTICPLNPMFNSREESNPADCWMNIKGANQCLKGKKITMELAEE